MVTSPRRRGQGRADSMSGARARAREGGSAVVRAISKNGSKWQLKQDALIFSADKNNRPKVQIFGTTNAAPQLTFSFTRMRVKFSAGQGVSFPPGGTHFFARQIPVPLLNAMAPMHSEVAQESASRKNGSRPVGMKLPAQR